jgi:hypothetical protein
MVIFLTIRYLASHHNIRNHPHLYFSRSVDPVRDHTIGIGLVLADKLLDYIVNATLLYMSLPARH